MDLAVKHLPSFDVFRWPEVVDSGTRPRNQVGDAEFPYRQTYVVFVREGFRRELRFAQEFPEPIRIPREVVSRYRGPHTGIDPDEKHTQARPDAIFQAQVRPVGFDDSS